MQAIKFMHSCTRGDCQFKRTMVPDSSTYTSAPPNTINVVPLYIGSVCKDPMMLCQGHDKARRVTTLNGRR